jgi:hypothetical protein
LLQKGEVIKVFDFVTVLNIVYLFFFVGYNSYVVMNYNIDDDTMTRRFIVTSIILVVLLGWWIVS